MDRALDAREARVHPLWCQLAEAHHALRGARAKAEDELRRALLDLESARANRVKAEEQLKLARENAALVKSTYDAGAATYLEVTDANSALLGAELTFLSETLNADLAVLKLQKAAGAFDPLSTPEAR